MEVNSLSTEAFIRKAKDLYGDLYDYSKVNYVNNKTKVEVICKEHGSFFIRPVNHISNKNGCPKCSRKLLKNDIIDNSIKNEDSSSINSLELSMNLLIKERDVLNVKILLLKLQIVHFGKGYLYPEIDINTSHRLKNTDYIKVVCPIHGEFTQNLQTHIRGSGCPKCSNIEKRSNDEFISKAKEAHGDYYDYSEVNYTNNKTNVSIICPIHGEFTQKPVNHISKQKNGCPKCAVEANTIPFEKFLEDSNIIHNNKYIYNRESYINITSNIDINCPIHGSFIQNAYKHSKGASCPKCINDERKDTLSEFTEKARKVHGDCYEYIGFSETLPSQQRKVVATCPTHGEFIQATDHHLKGNGCPKCAATYQYDTSGFLERVSKIIHHQKPFRNYSYDKTIYSTSKNYVTVTCEKHGDFTVRPNNFLQGTGCSRCAIEDQSSKMEIELQEWLRSLNVQFIANDRTEISPKELDIYIPDKKVAIELHGNYYHSELVMGYEKAKKHIREKFLLCESKGIHLLQFYQDEWIYKNLQVKNMIASKLGISGIVNDRVYARKTNVVFLDKSIYHTDICNFFEVNHIQGKCAYKKAYGLEFNNEIVAIMLFSHITSHRGSIPNEHEHELVRFATSKNVVGGASKLLSAFINDHQDFSVITSYSDNRYSNGNMYVQLGFSLVAEREEDYFYIHGKEDNYLKRFHKTYMKKDNQKKKLTDFNPNETEYVNANRNGYYRIFTAGIKKWALYKT